MLPKKARVRLRQSEAFFPLAYHVIVANHVVLPSICPGLTLNRRGFRSIVPSSSPIKCGGQSLTLFASIILVSDEYHSPIIKDGHQ